MPQNNATRVFVLLNQLWHLKQKKSPHLFFGRLIQTSPQTADQISFSTEVNPLDGSSCWLFQPGPVCSACSTLSVPRLTLHHHYVFQREAETRLQSHLDQKERILICVFDLLKTGSRVECDFLSAFSTNSYIVFILEKKKIYFLQIESAKQYLVKSLKWSPWCVGSLRCHISPSS